MKRFFEWMGKHRFVKNLVLAVCAIIVLVVAAHVLLGVFTHHNRHEAVPDFTGMTLSEATRAGRSGQLRVEVNDSVYYPQFAPGVILSQKPAAHTEVKSGRRILVTVNASRPMMVRIPYVTGVSLRQAVNDLEVAGFGVGTLIYKSDIATDYVLETRLGDEKITRESGMEAEQGSGITLVVGINSDDDGAVIVPKVVGLPLAEAEGRLWENGLNVAVASDDANAGAMRVARQSISGGVKANRGAKVTLHLEDRQEE